MTQHTWTQPERTWDMTPEAYEMHCEAMYDAFLDAKAQEYLDQGYSEADDVWVYSKGNTHRVDCYVGGELMTHERTDLTKQEAKLLALKVESRMMMVNLVHWRVVDND